jgi:hypothetical protein
MRQLRAFLFPFAMWFFLMAWITRYHRDDTITQLSWSLATLTKDYNNMSWDLANEKRFLDNLQDYNIQRNKEFRHLIKTTGSWALNDKVWIEGMPKHITFTGVIYDREDNGNHDDYTIVWYAMYNNNDWTKDWEWDYKYIIEYSYAIVDNWGERLWETRRELVAPSDFIEVPNLSEDPYLYDKQYQKLLWVEMD